MGDKRFILGLFVMFFAIVAIAQEKNKFRPPDITYKTQSFVCPEFQIDSLFIENLHTILFKEGDDYMSDKVSNPREKSWKHFFVYFEKNDSLSYNITVSLWNTPSSRAIGFFQYNNFYFWFSNDVPDNIILETKSKKQFSYKEYLPMIIDPRFWFLTYNSQTGDIRINEEPSF